MIKMTKTGQETSKCIKTKKILTIIRSSWGTGKIKVLDTSTEHPPQADTQTRHPPNQTGHKLGKKNANDLMKAELPTWELICSDHHLQPLHLFPFSSSTQTPAQPVRTESISLFLRQNSTKPNKKCFPPSRWLICWTSLDITSWRE